MREGWPGIKQRIHGFWLMRNSEDHMKLGMGICSVNLGHLLPAKVSTEIHLSHQQTYQDS